MRIVIATVMREQGTTGVQSHFNSLLSSLKSRGDEVSLVNSFSAPAALYTPIYALRPLLFKHWLKGFGTFWYRYWHYRFLLWGLIRHLRKNHTDIINAQCPLAAKAALLARERTGSGCKIVLTCHFNISQADEFAGKGELSKKGSYFRKIVALERQMLSSVDGVVFVSEFARREIYARHALATANSRVIHNGIGEETNGTKISRAQLGIPEDAFVILTVGTLEPRKNQYSWINSMLDLLKARPSIHILLIGDGQDRKRIASLVSKSDLGARVRLLGFRTDVRQILKLTDVYCHPALMESLGIAVIEAAEAGLPIVAANTGGIPEIVDHLQSGLLINQEEGEKAFGSWIEKLHNSAALRTKLGNAARSRFLANFTEEAMAQAYMTYFREVRQKPL